MGEKKQWAKNNKGGSQLKGRIWKLGKQFGGESFPFGGGETARKFAGGTVKEGKILGESFATWCEERTQRLDPPWFEVHFGQCSFSDGGGGGAHLQGSMNGDIRNNSLKKKEAPRPIGCFCRLCLWVGL